MPDHPTTRVLALLELLQAHGRLSGAEIATRLELDRRTVRRYISLLEELGVPITTERGPHGGYELVAGYKLPPMLFTNDEALVLSLGLVAIGGIGLANATHAIAGAQAKLERVMPPAMRERMRSVSESVAFAPAAATIPPNANALTALSAAAHARRGVRLHYQAQSGAETERDFDPYGLAFRSGRWYTVGLCHLRGGLRSFRLDRVLAVVAQPRPFRPPAGFDILAHLAEGLATLPRRYTIEVLLHTDLESARRGLFPAIGVLQPEGKRVVLHGQADDLQWFARELAHLPWRFEIRRPRQLTAALTSHARSLLPKTT